MPRTIERAVSEMLEPPFGEFAGVPALERLAAKAGSWPEAVEDWQWCARFAYQVIERRGTGGGCFRLMYSRFLAEAGRAEAPLAAEAAARWTELAESFKAASESNEPRQELWRAVGEGAEQVLEAERKLWNALQADPFRTSPAYSEENLGSDSRPHRFVDPNPGYSAAMTIGAGIFLIAVGAILKFATNFHVQGVSIDTIGVILMVAGAVGLLIGLFKSSGPAAPPPLAPGEVPPVEERREVRDPAYRDQPPRY